MSELVGHIMTNPEPEDVKNVQTFLQCRLNDCSKSVNNSYFSSLFVGRYRVFKNKPHGNIKVSQ